MLDKVDLWLYLDEVINPPMPLSFVCYNLDTSAVFYLQIFKGIGQNFVEKGTTRRY